MRRKLEPSHSNNYSLKKSYVLRQLFFNFFSKGLKTALYVLLLAEKKGDNCRKMHFLTSLWAILSFVRLHL
ncbi:hypothetical protein BH09BAC1_BH09BAC1_03650 [soil metagenome]